MPGDPVSRVCGWAVDDLWAVRTHWASASSTWFGLRAWVVDNATPSLASGAIKDSVWDAGFKRSWMVNGRFLADGSSGNQSGTLLPMNHRSRDNI